MARYRVEKDAETFQEVGQPRGQVLGAVDSASIANSSLTGVELGV